MCLSAIGSHFPACTVATISDTFTTTTVVWINICAAARKLLFPHFDQERIEFDGCELVEYRKRMKRFIIVQTLSLASAGMRKLGITICWTSFRFLLCWEISKNGWNYNFWVILLLCSRNKEFSSIAYRVYWWGYRSQGTAVLLYQQVLTLLSALLLAIICFFFFSVL